MRLLIVVLIVFLLAAPAGAQMIERETSLVFDGTIDMVSITGSGVAEAVIVIQGDGYGQMAYTSKATDESLDHDVTLQIAPSEERKGTPFHKGIYAITGVKLNGDKYVQKVEGHAELEQSVSVSLDTFKELVFGSTVRVAGIYQRHVNLKNDEITLYEVLKMVGTGESKDYIRFGPEE